LYANDLAQTNNNHSDDSGGEANHEEEDAAPKSAPHTPARDTHTQS